MTAIAADPTPLTLTDDGTVRVGGTRVTLDSVIDGYLQGDSADAIAESYPSVPLAAIYATVAYYLNHRAEVDAYLARRQAEAEAIRAQIEKEFPPDGFRARLLARKAASA